MELGWDRNWSKMAMAREGVEGEEGEPGGGGVGCVAAIP